MKVMTWVHVARTVKVYDAFIHDSIIHGDLVEAEAHFLNYLLDDGEPRDKVYGVRSRHIAPLRRTMNDREHKWQRYGLSYRILVDPDDPPEFLKGAPL